MSTPDFDIGSISQLLSSLSAQDMEKLKNAAESMFSSPEEPEKKNRQNTAGDFDFSSFARLASLMSVLSSQQQDARCDLLSALRPMLGTDKQQKVDQAIKMIRLFSILPKLRELS